MPLVKKLTQAWNLPDIWQHWDGKGDGMYLDYRQDRLHHFQPRIWLVGVQQEEGTSS